MVFSGVTFGHGTAQLQRQQVHTPWRYRAPLPQPTDTANLPGSFQPSRQAVITLSSHLFCQLATLARCHQQWLCCHVFPLEVLLVGHSVKHTWAWSAAAGKSVLAWIVLRREAQEDDTEQAPSVAVKDITLTLQSFRDSIAFHPSKWTYGKGPLCSGNCLSPKRNPTPVISETLNFLSSTVLQNKSIYNYANKA